MSPPKFSHVFMVLVASLLISCHGQGRVYWPEVPGDGSYSLHILVDGVERPTTYHQGHYYIQGTLGDRYTLRVNNSSSRRVEAVIAVDGRDVLDGRPSDLDRRGYVIPAYSSIDVDGFRLNLDEVAAFRFTDVPDSYAARMGTPWQVGIIDVAIFPERVRQVYYPPRSPYVLGDRRSAPAEAGVQAESAPGDGYAAKRRDSRNLGTEFGERRWSTVSETSFERQNWRRPQARLAVRYDNREGLCHLGLDGYCRHPWPRHYDPPVVPEPRRDFAEPPPGWEHFSQWY